MLRKALVVDDSRSARFAMRKLLEARGFAVDTAESATEAYAYLERGRPDVVFLDHQMPGTDGMDALRAMRKEPSLAGLPIILCSGNDCDGFADEARAIGATDILPKPPSNDHIRAVLERATANAVAAVSSVPTKIHAIREAASAVEEVVARSLAAMRSLSEATSAVDPAAHGLNSAARIGNIEQLGLPSQPLPAVAPVELPVPVSAAAPAVPVPAPTPEPQPAAAAAAMEPARASAIEAEAADLRALFRDLSARIAKIEQAVEKLAAERNTDQPTQAEVVQVIDARISYMSANMGLLGTQVENRLNDFQRTLERQRDTSERREAAIRDTASSAAEVTVQRIVESLSGQLAERVTETVLRLLKPAAMNAQRDSNRFNRRSGKSLDGRH